MGLKKIVSLVIVFALLVLLCSCSGSAFKKELLALNSEEFCMDVALFSYDNCGGNLISYKETKEVKELHIFDRCAFFDSSHYVLSLSGADSDDYRYQVEVVVISDEGEINRTVNLGDFGLRSHPNSTTIHEYSRFYQSCYFAPADGPKDILQRYYDDGVISKYHKGCIYVRDTSRCVKYDIMDDNVLEVSKEEEQRIYERGYSYSISNDYSSVTVNNLKTDESRIITLESVAGCSEDFSRIVERLSRKYVIFEKRKRTDRAFDNFVFREIDGELYMTIYLYSLFGMSIPVVFKYQFETNRFEFCVAGDTNTIPLPIAILK